MNKRHYEHTLPNIRGSLSNTYFNPMEHLNPVDQARQLAAEVVKRLGQLNLHRRELERKLHVANGFFTSLEEKK